MASGKVLYSRDKEFAHLKWLAQLYPDPMREVLLSFFLFEPKFSCALAKNYSQDKDLYYIIGHLFRSISALNQVLFAFNRVYCLNEKKAALRIEGLPAAPADYRRRVNRILSLTEENIVASIDELERLCGEVEGMASAQ